MKAILCLAVCLCSYCSLYSQSAYPSYRTIVNRLFDEYSPNSDDYYQLTFQKKPDGWHISTEVYKNGDFSELTNELYWDKASGDYLPLNFTKRGPWAISEEKEALLNDWRADIFDVCPYYNYAGWEMDVIHEYGKEPSTLSDTTLYGLGRAYSSYSSSLVSIKHGISNVVGQFDLKPSETLTEKQLSVYRKYQHAAIEAFQMLAKRSPEFETIVGSIYTKASNEHVTSFINLMMYSDETEALKELENDIYDLFYLSFARNVLNSLEPNAILFTGGDNDTFPLWYLQAKYGIRRDVTVMVTSFLNMNRYIRMVNSRNEIFTPIELTIDPVDYDASGPNAYLPIEPNLEVVNAHKYIQLIDEHNPGLQKPLADSYYNFIPSGDIELTTESFFENDSLPTSLQKHRLKKKMIISVKPNINGIELKDLLVLDLLTTNNWTRPVYFDESALSRVSFDLEEHIVMEGLCSQLLPIRLTDAVDYDKMHHLVKNIFDWNFLPTTEETSQDKKNFILNYRFVINSLVHALIENNEPDRASDVLISSFKWMPLVIYPLDYSNAAQVDYLLQLNKKDLAIDIGEKLFNQAHDELIAMAKTKGENDYQVRVNVYIIQTLIETFKKHGIDELVVKYESAYEEISWG
ncbi:hypothetical protein JMN32_10505 [Fulvivirga sp. 29W222]|uniref:Uncharacterized protein n=1 Tax=Fulvivirga marina TaxID=2494733 RepID=A0A937FVD6_9BACT|nr:hypothetical protein [Fulvivirga marina]MBL6446744.1 hypothetical protein [Fulvivirga marina]